MYFYQRVGFCSSLIYKCIHFGLENPCSGFHDNRSDFWDYFFPFILGGEELLSPSISSAMGKQNCCLGGKSASFKSETSARFLKHKWKMHEKNGTANLAQVWVRFFVHEKSTAYVIPGNFSHIPPSQVLNKLLWYPWIALCWHTAK